MSQTLWILALPVALLATCGLSGDAGAPLADFLLLRSGGRLEGAPEVRVGHLRDAFVGRVRCGAQQGMPSKLCRECLSSRRIMDITHGQNASFANETSIDDVARASIVILNYMLSFQTSCTVESIRLGYVGSCRLYEQCLSELHGRLSSVRTGSSDESLEALERILRDVKAVFEPDPSKQCFSAEMVMKEMRAKPQEFDALPRDVAAVLLITGHLFSGECIDVGESVADFLDDIFLHYGEGCERVMSQSGFKKLWTDLQIQRKGKHVDHGVQKNTCSNIDIRSPENTEKYVPHDATEKGKDVADALVTEVAFGVGPPRATEAKKSETPTWIPGSPSSVPDSDSEKASSGHSDVDSNRPHDHHVYVVHKGKDEHDDEDKFEVVISHDSSRRRTRHAIHADDHEHKNLANECLPTDDLLQRFLSPGDKMITSSAFLQLCPALVQQAVSGVCNSRITTAYLNLLNANGTAEIHQEVASKDSNPWFSVGAVTIITLLSLMGLFLLPVLKKSFFVHINGFFTGLAFGTMSGDVVLHLMPQYLGMHKHDGDEHDHDEELSLSRLFPSHLQLQLAFLLTMYVLFLVECLFSALMGEEKAHSGHSHGPVEVPLNDLTVVSNRGDSEIKPKPSLCCTVLDFLKPSNLFAGISSKAVVIILADTVHNFADGMAIAVGFSTSYKDGVSTSVAVLFHELPHEIGDFAVLMNTGMCFWKAFVFNILSGLSAFLGLGVGEVAANAFREWLLCITAGLFFFVVMVELLPDMRLESRAKWREFVVKIFGSVLGMGTMICIAMYELYAT